MSGEVRWRANFDAGSAYREDRFEVDHLTPVHVLTDEDLAARVASAAAEAWDEGYDTRVRFCRDGHHGNPERNPYRGGAVTG